MFVNLLHEHNVYTSLKKTFFFAAKKIGYELIEVPPTKDNTDIIFKTETNHLQNMKIDLLPNNIYITNSPIIGIETWRIKINKNAAFIVEEYYNRQEIKDIVASSIITFFREYPFIALTKRTAAYLKNNKITVHLIPPATKKIKYCKKKKHILFQSRLIESKNPLLIVEMAKRMDNENFVIIGRGPLTQRLQKECEKLNNVEYVPFVDDKKLIEYRANAKLFVHLAKRDPVGFVVIEAMGAAIPIMVSSGTGASDYVPRDMVVNNLQIDALVKKAESILNNEKEYSKMTEEAFKKEHLDINDPYFYSLAEQLVSYIKKRWPWLTNKNTRQT